ncbi:calpain-A-like isoform X2 [Mya arenaria]|uniref:calpain-A-like isoform X2 n=1 Tax=Mya arenaria TaxID=6604 RepID=UPI0022E43420|nr:calpain-A-like isoform X2 [Mya arenaria]
MLYLQTVAKSHQQLTEMDSRLTTPRRSESFRSATNKLDISYQSAVSATPGGLTYGTLRERALARRVFFEDASFPANDTSLAIRYKSFSEPIEWMRPHDISKRPKFISKNPGNFAVQSGSLSDTWLLPAFSCLTVAPTLIRKCIPEEQAFNEQYAGIFRFRFWRYGEWVEVVVDDRLPTHKGQLIFLRNSDPNEFWAPLLEKAYAKLYGSYSAIHGGQLHGALQDLTGGVTDTFQFREHATTLQRVIDLSMCRATLMAATIAAPVGSVPHRQLPNGLVTGRGYSVTGYAEFPHEGSNVVLVRLRNPWGPAEFKGAWNRQSGLWSKVPDDIKKRLGFSDLTDNEFWMPFSEFSKLFTSLELCHLPPEAWNMEPRMRHRHPWKAAEAHRQWRKGYNAGGGLNSQIFQCNNQFYMELQKQSNVILSLMQKYHSFGQQNNFIPCGLLVFQSPKGRINRLPAGHFATSKPIATVGILAERDMVSFSTLPAGGYVVVPCTARAGLEGKYCLRMFTDDKDAVIRELDEPDTCIASYVDRHLDSDTMYILRSRFLMFCNRYEEIDGYGLRQMLCHKPSASTASLLCCEPEKLDMSIERLFLSAETCKAAVTIEDKDMNGRLNYIEFLSLLQKLLLWQRIYKKYAVGNGSVIDSYSLRNAFKLAGFTLSNRVLEALVLRFSAKDYTNLEGFINAVVKLHVAHQRHRQVSADQPGMTDAENRKYLQELLRAAIYS